MALLSLKDVSFTYGGRNLLETVTVQIERGDRVGLLGRNGCGKSTLMKLINGELNPDNGEIVREPGLRVGRLIQEVPTSSASAVQDVIAEGLGAEGALLARYHALCVQLGQKSTKAIED